MRLLSVIIVLCVFYSLDAAVSYGLHAVNPGNNTSINQFIVFNVHDLKRKHLQHENTNKSKYRLYCCLFIHFLHFICFFSFVRDSDYPGKCWDSNSNKTYNVGKHQLKNGCGEITCSEKFTLYTKTSVQIKINNKITIHMSWKRV